MGRTAARARRAHGPADRPDVLRGRLLRQLVGGQKSADNENPLFQWALQRALYLDANARPSSESVAAFLKANGIEYVYAETDDPNALVPDAVPVITSGPVQVLRLP